MKRKDNENADHAKEKSNPSRRDFFARTAAVGALGAGSLLATPAAAQVTAADDSGIEWAHEADILVVGLGLGGLSASLRALQEGATVVCVDKAARTPSESESTWEGRELAKRASIGGNFNLSGQILHFGTPSLASDPQAIRDYMKTKGDPANPPVMDKLVERGKQSLDWLLEQIADNPDIDIIENSIYPGGPSTVTPRKDTADPFAYWELRRKPGGVADYTQFGGYLTSMHLLSRIEAAGGTVLEQTKVWKLITNASGEVIGARIRPVDGGPSTNVRAKAVILATGGFQKSKELVTRWYGPLAGNWIPGCNQNNTGDGHYMAMELGAQMINLNAFYGELDPYDARFNPDMMMQFSFPYAAVHNGILVNENGDRVTDEAGTRFFHANAMVRGVENLRHLVVFDNSVYEQPVVKLTVDAMLEAGMTKSVFRADTLEDLVAATVAAADDDLRTDAGWLFSPRLIDTVEEYNAAVSGGTAERLSPPRTGSPSPIANAPFWGIVCLPGTGWTQGGPKINADGAILDSDNLPIPGLYGTGDLVTGNSMGSTNNSHGGYVGGLGPALVWGLMSAESAVAYARNAG